MSSAPSADRGADPVRRIALPLPAFSFPNIVSWAARAFGGPSHPKRRVEGGDEANGGDGRDGKDGKEGDDWPSSRRRPASDRADQQLLALMRANPGATIARLTKLSGRSRSLKRPLQIATAAVAGGGSGHSLRLFKQNDLQSMTICNPIRLPHLHPVVIRFADRIVAAGMTVFLPVLFGEPGRPGPPAGRARSSNGCARSPVRRMPNAAAAASAPSACASPADSRSP